MRIFLFFFLTVLVARSYATDEKVFSFSFGPVSIGEARVPISVKDFEVSINAPQERVRVEIESDSIQWIRADQNILSPRARVFLLIKGDASNLHLKYQGREVLLQQKSETEAFSTIYVSLFYPESIKIFEREKFLGEVVVKPKMTQKVSQKKSKLIDYSCSPYNLSIEGIDQDYLSVSCRLGRMGHFGNEKPFLEVNWTATNVHLLDGSSPPYVAILTDSSPVITKVKSSSGEEDKVVLKANLPDRLYRLRTALGFGPYSFSSADEGEKNKSPLAPAGMLYANFMLTEASSFRAFDALVSQKSFFNNAGLYFAYELGRAFDQRVEIVALLGFQSLSYRYKRGASMNTSIIYPQGVELVLKHFWGIENRDLVYGMFISPSKNEDYKNLWLRYGRRVFGEVNYISWSENKRSASMWGLSVGFPFMSFF